MRVYVAGPMRGHPGSNFPAFEEAAARLRRVGHEVVSPAEGGVGKADPGEDAYRMLVRRGIQLMLECHAVALLEGWEKSTGARLERDVALGAGLEVGTVEEIETLGLRPLRWESEVEGPELEPQRYYPGDAGFDLVCSEDVKVGFRAFVDVPCGVSVALPPGVWALIIGRSSTLRQRELMVAPGVIDNGWRGPLFAGVWNLGRTPTEVRAGDRVAQLIPFPLTAAELALERVGELPPGDRGDAGFGSTGP